MPNSSETAKSQPTSRIQSGTVIIGRGFLPPRQGGTWEEADEKRGQENGRMPRSVTVECFALNQHTHTHILLVLSTLQAGSEHVLSSQFYLIPNSDNVRTLYNVSRLDSQLKLTRNQQNNNNYHAQIRLT